MTSNTEVRISPARRRTASDFATAPEPGTTAECTTTCSTCNLRELCLPCCDLTRSEITCAGRLLFNRFRVQRGESLYRAGDRFTYVYAVRDGFFKSTALLDNGRNQVTGFSMPGDVLGLDGIEPQRHTCDTVALEDSDVCAIPFAGLQALAQEIPSLQRRFHKMMSREIVRKHGVMLLLGSMNAEERVAMFVRNLSQRFAARGCSPSDIKLRMTREEIGSYLGLTLTTVSRIFSKFQEERLLSVRWRSIRILDGAGLGRVMCRELD